MMQTRVVVKEPNGVQRTVPLTAQGLTIGRSPDNDLVINYPITSRHHAQITSGGGNFYVTDLDSGNGTFMGDVRLTPNEATIWALGIPVRIGDVLLQLEQGQFQPQTLEQPPEPAAGKLAGAERQRTDIVTGEVSDQSSQKGTNRLWLVLIILVVFACICAVLSSAGYIFLFAG